MTKIIIPDYFLKGKSIMEDTVNHMLIEKEKQSQTFSEKSTLPVQHMSVWVARTEIGCWGEKVEKYDCKQLDLTRCHRECR